mmetsp:Transcript_5913/g.21366  ORF Transcript_5913/g.21366 Transcript_5913/m.21366 type:complete len:232 (-) Transcript_5913:809-1504(-)
MSYAARTPTFKPCVCGTMEHKTRMSPCLAASTAHMRANAQGGTNSLRGVSAVYTLLVETFPEARDNNELASFASLRVVVFICTLRVRGFMELCANGTGESKVGTSRVSKSELPRSPPEASMRTFNNPLTAMAPRQIMVSAARLRAPLGLSMFASIVVASADSMGCLPFARLTSSPAKSSSKVRRSSSGRHTCFFNFWAFSIAAASSSALTKSTPASLSARRILILLFVTTA